jgi:hypothetical protein
MTIDGVANSPNGLPAMYEYRNSNPSSPAFGMIDKPSFLWAGGMYLQVLYRLLAVEENEWNLAISGELPSECDSVSCAFAFGGLRRLSIWRTPNEDRTLKADGVSIPSRILPLDLRVTQKWSMSTNRQRHPFLSRANAIVHTAVYDTTNNQLICEVSSFNGHSTRLVVESDNSPKETIAAGVVVHPLKSSPDKNGRRRTTIEFGGSSNRQRIIVNF